MNSFALWVGVGAASGLWQVARSSLQKQSAVFVNMGLILMFTSLLGARFSYVWVNREYFSEHLVEIPQLWLGGLSWPGAVVGAWIVFLSLLLTQHSSHYSPGELGDGLYPLLPPLSVSIWLGCWLAGTAYGPELPAGTWWAVPSLDEAGAYAPRWPLQLLAALSLLVYFLLLERLVKPSRSPGRLSGLAGFGIMIHLLCISLLRADPGLSWNGMRADAWIAIACTAAFMVMVLIFNLVKMKDHRI